MALPEPKNIIEYNARQFENMRIEGVGVEVTIHMPCPFCGAKNFLSYRVLDVEEGLSRGATCQDCRRGLRAIFNRTLNNTAFRFVQTEGADPPEWVEGIRRFDPLIDADNPHKFDEAGWCERCCQSRLEVTKAQLLECV